MSAPPKHPPGKGLFGWLGRQIGYVTRAIRHPVSTADAQKPAEAPTEPQTIYRERKVHEQPMPGTPQITLRRTVIDEAIVKRDERPAN